MVPVPSGAKRISSTAETPNPRPRARRGGAARRRRSGIPSERPDPQANAESKAGADPDRAVVDPFGGGGPGVPVHRVREVGDERERRLGRQRRLDMFGDPGQRSTPIRAILGSGTGAPDHRPRRWPGPRDRQPRGTGWTSGRSSTTDSSCRSMASFSRVGIAVRRRLFRWMSPARRCIAAFGQS